MAQALSMDLRDRVSSSIDAELSCRAEADRFGIGVATAVRWRQLAFRTGRAVGDAPLLLELSEHALDTVAILVAPIFRMDGAVFVSLDRTSSFSAP